MRNSLTRLRVFLEGLTFGLPEMIHWIRFRIVDLSIASTGDDSKMIQLRAYVVLSLLAHLRYPYCHHTTGPHHR